MAEEKYILDEQAGFLLRQVTQRHVGIFAGLMAAALTPPQFSALVILYQHGPCSQNELGRRIATDGATIKGIVNRLTRRGIMQTAPDAQDGRMLTISLTQAGTAMARDCIEAGTKITESTLAPLTVRERSTLITLLKKLR